MQGMLNASPCNANYYITMNNEKQVSKMPLFSKVPSKLFETFFGNKI